MAKSASMTMMRKAVGAVNNKLMYLNKHPNGDYENLLAALKSGNGKKFIPMLVPYVEDVIDEIEGSDSSGIFTDSDIVDVADEVADRHMRSIGLLDEGKNKSHYQKEETNIKEEILEGVEAYTLKKTKVEKNKIEDDSDEVQTIVYYDIMLRGKKVGQITWEDYFGHVQGTLHGMDIKRVYGKPVVSQKDVQPWLHNFLKSKEGAKFAMQAEAKDCGCSDTKEEQEFMFAIKRKNKLKESLMAKAMESLKQNLVVEAKQSAKKSKYGKYGLTAEGFDKIVNDVVTLISSHKKTVDITKIYEMLMKKKTNEAVKLIMPYVEDHATEYENEYSTDDNSFMITDNDLVELAKEVAAELADRMKKG